MYKEATFKQKFEDLKQWAPGIIETIKKDLKADHLGQDPLFFKKFFPGKHVAKLTVEEMAPVYIQSIKEEEKGEQIAEFIASRWLLKNSEIYSFFEEKLSQIAPDFTEIEELSSDQADRLIGESTKEFGSVRTYLFSVLNSVVFPEKHYVELRKKAELESKKALENAKVKAEEEAKAKEAQDHATEIARMKDKYEKKISGLEKKYLIDVQGLKKQIAQLQKKLQGTHS